MANLAGLEVYALPEDIVAALSRERTAAVIDSGVTEIYCAEGVASVDNLVEDGNILVVADTSGDTNLFARKLFHELCAATHWRITLLDADTWGLLQG